MSQAANWDLGDLKNRLRQAGSSQNTGTVHQVRGLVIEANGPNLAIGDTCRIETRGGRASVFAEVVGFRDHKMLLMPFGDMNQLGPGVGCTPLLMLAQFHVVLACWGVLLMDWESPWIVGGDSSMIMSALCVPGHLQPFSAFRFRMFFRRVYVRWIRSRRLVEDSGRALCR